MLEFIEGAVVGAVVMFLAQLAFPKVSDVIGNIHRSRALSSAKATLAAEAARVAAIAAAQKTVAAAVVPPPPAPPNPLVTGATGATGA